MESVRFGLEVYFVRTSSGFGISSLVFSVFEFVL